MATRDNLWPLKKHSMFQSLRGKNQYSSLNLNQNHKLLNQSFVQSNSKSVVNNKGLDSKFDESKNKKGSLNLWNKSSSNQAFKSFNAFDEVGKDDAKKRWKNESSSNPKINSSTLSLHITAYENSVEGGDTVKLDKKEGLKKKEKSPGSIEVKKQVFIVSTLNPIEFPRQQTDDASKPEVMQFTASQQLLNPNQLGSSKNGQQGPQSDEDDAPPVLVHFNQRPASSNNGQQRTQNVADVLPHLAHFNEHPPLSSARNSDTETCDVGELAEEGEIIDNKEDEPRVSEALSLSEPSQILAAELSSVAENQSISQSVTTTTATPSMPKESETSVKSPASQEEEASTQKRSSLSYAKKKQALPSYVSQLPPRRRQRWTEAVLCKFFREGYCRDGETCAYSHNAADSNRKPELCKYYEQGFCKKGLACTLLHGEYPCKAFHEGKCDKNPCKYSHMPLNDYTRTIFEQMVQDEALAAKIVIPMQPAKRKVLLRRPGPNAEPPQIAKASPKREEQQPLSVLADSAHDFDPSKFNIENEAGNESKPFVAMTSAQEPDEQLVADFMPENQKPFILLPEASNDAPDAIGMSISDMLDQLAEPPVNNSNVINLEDLIKSPVKIKKTRPVDPRRRPLLQTPINGPPQHAQQVPINGAPPVFPINNGPMNTAPPVAAAMDDAHFKSLVEKQLQMVNEFKLNDSEGGNSYNEQRYDEGPRGRFREDEEHYRERRDYDRGYPERGGGFSERGGYSNYEERGGRYDESYQSYEEDPHYRGPSRYPPPSSRGSGIRGGGGSRGFHEAERYPRRPNPSERFDSRWEGGRSESYRREPYHRERERRDYGSRSGGSSRFRERSRSRSPRRNESAVEEKKE